MARFTLRAPHELARFIAPKGSVALDGVSLTVNEVDGDTFSVLIIPHTLAVTTFGALRQGDDVNLEIDTMARYAARLMETQIEPLFAARALATTRLNKELENMAKKTSAAKKRDTRARADRGSALLRAYCRRAARRARRACSTRPARTYDRIAVPGALEVPAAIAMALDAAKAKRAPYDGVVALGCVIQGETYHFEMVSNESARGLMDLRIDRQLAARQRHPHRRQRSAGAGRARAPTAATRAPRPRAPRSP